MRILTWLFVLVAALTAPAPTVPTGVGLAGAGSARAAMPPVHGASLGAWGSAARGISGAPVRGAPVYGAPVRGAPVYRAPASGYRWPLDGFPEVVRRFDPPPRPWLPGHRGVDLAAAPGATVRAAGAGVVAFAGSVAGRGVVSVQHANGLRTTYEPVEPRVTEGATVAAGDALGVLVAGHAGCPVDACLHWGLRRGETYLDPLALLGFGRMRLRPLQVPQETG